MTLRTRTLEDSASFHIGEVRETSRSGGLRDRWLSSILLACRPHKPPSSSYQSRKHFVDETLIGSPGVFESKRHYSIAVQSPVGDETSVVLIGGVHRNLVIS